MDCFEPNNFFLVAYFKIGDFGKSPAWITELQVKFTIIDTGTDYPSIPDYKNWVNIMYRDAVGRVVRPDDPMKSGCQFTDPKGLSWEAFDQIKKSLKYLWCYGLIKYEDFLGDSHETAFSAQYQSVTDTEGKEAGYWIPDNGPSAYHYHDRKRSKNTGLSEPE